MEVVAYEPEHLERLRLQPAQAYLSGRIGSEYARAMVVDGQSFSALSGDRVIACAGLIPLWAGRAHAWALLAEDAGRDLLAVHRAVGRFLSLSTVRRIETSVYHEFAAAHRWARLLGFRWEGLMRGYAPDGRDCDLYARVR